MSSTNSCNGVVAADGPAAVPVAAQVRRDDVVVATEIPGDPVPAAGVVAAAVEQEERRAPSSLPQSKKWRRRR